MDARADKAVPFRSRLAPRDPERTRSTILAAATTEFSRKGLDGARVDKIARRSGVNKRMIYHYFGDKEGLYLAVLEKSYTAIRAAEFEAEPGRPGPGRGHAHFGAVHLEVPCPRIRNSSACLQPRTCIVRPTSKSCLTFASCIHR